MHSARGERESVREKENGGKFKPRGADRVRVKEKKRGENRVRGVIFSEYIKTRRFAKNASKTTSFR